MGPANRPARHSIYLPLVTTRIGFLFLSGILLLSGISLLAAADDMAPQVAQQMPSLLATYKGAPPASGAFRARGTHRRFAGGGITEGLGYACTEHVGKYGDGRAAAGVVAILKNGQGPTLLVRTELDALPVEEKTGLPYASQVRTKNDAGQEVGVMHACGHDLHMTSLVGTARMLAAWKDR